MLKGSGESLTKRQDKKTSAMRLVNCGAVN